MGEWMNREGRENGGDGEDGEGVSAKSFGLTASTDWLSGLHLVRECQHVACPWGLGNEGRSNYFSTFPISPSLPTSPISPHPPSPPVSLIHSSHLSTHFSIKTVPRIVE